MRLNRAFDIKKEECDPSKFVSRSKELETEWLSALLLRSGVPQIMIKRAIDDTNGFASKWPEFLYSNHSLFIEKSVMGQSVEVYKLNEDRKKSKIAGWEKPEMVKLISKDGNISYEIHLKYWQIL